MTNLSDTQQTDSADLFKPGALVSWVYFVGKDRSIPAKICHAEVMRVLMTERSVSSTIISQSKTGMIYKFIRVGPIPYSGKIGLVPGHIAPTKEAVEFALSRLKGAKQ